LGLLIGSDLPEWAHEPRKAPERSTHWITKLKRTKIPGAHLCLDSEARIVKVAGRFEHRFAVACSQLVPEHEDAFTPGLFNNGHESPGDLWSYVDDLCDEHGELVVWAHNLPYDLRVCDGLSQLLKRGWRLENISLMRTASWAAWVKGKSKLTLTDSVSWWKVGLDKLAAEQGVKRRRFDYVHATDRQLLKRCEEDVALLADAVAATLTWLRVEDLGNFRPTGSGQSHAAWRKRFMPERSVRVHDNGMALYVERQAMHTGRTEAWRLGHIPEKLHEFDLNLAYCRIAACNRLPQWLNGESGSMTVKQYRATPPEQAVLADVTVTTDWELVPSTRNGRVIWPVGKFRTQLWSPEIDLLLDHGAKVEFNYCWLYHTGDALAGMATWILDKLTSEQADMHPAVARTLKHWARTLVGRMALRYRQWDYDGENERADLCISYEPDADTGDVYREMRVGNTVLLLAQLAESKSSCPMVPGWVQSRCRAILWDIAEAAGTQNVFYMDTDGLLIDETGRTFLERKGLSGRDWQLAYKGGHNGIVIHGERNVEVGSDYRLAGIPKSAERKDSRTFEGEMWSGLERALEQGHTDHVAVTPAKWQLKPESHKREVIGGSFTQPYRLSAD
jgi:hypothetical protein